MDNDGITDLVVGSRDDGRVVTMLGNGDGTFSAAMPRAVDSIWQLVAGDVNGDGNLDVASANRFDHTAAIVIGAGDGTFESTRVVAQPGQTLSTDLGDLDGDDDLDWIVSNAGAGWNLYVNDGEGNFFLLETQAPPEVACCAALVDLDNDGDLDLALSDESVDDVILKLNGAVSPLPCPPSPSVCRTPTESGRAALQISHGVPAHRRKVIWKWIAGAATTTAEYGTPSTTDHYTLCLYEGGALVSSVTAPAGGQCPGGACWQGTSKGHQYRDRDTDPFGAEKILLKSGSDGRAKILFRARGVHFQTPDLHGSPGPVDVQLFRSGSPICWGARYSAPFIKDDMVSFKDRAD